MRLPDGSRVSNWSEPWREACEVAVLVGLPSPDAEIVRIAVRRSNNDVAVRDRIAAHLRRLVAVERARRDTLPAALEHEARAILALPDKPARRARLAAIEAAEGPLHRADVERVVLALWQS